MVPPAGPVEGATPTWTVAAVARRLGVAPATLRSWSHRYGIGPAEHQAGRYRRYTDNDVAELETMQRLVDGGMVLASAAAVARRRHRGTPATGTPGSAAPGAGPESIDEAPPVLTVSSGEVRALVQAAQRLDADTLLHTLDLSLARRDLTTTWNQLCRPALTALDNPELPTPCIDAALALAWAVSTSLRRRSPVGTVAAPRSRPVLLACAPTEHHTLALDALRAALAEQHVAAQIVGPAAPTSALVHAAERTSPCAVFLWAQRAATARPTALRRLLPHADTVAAAGPGWSPTGLPAGIPWVNTLDDAVRLARRAADAPAAPGRDRAITAR